MMPLNNQLMKAEALRKDPEWKRSRLAVWASLHAVRTAVRLPSVVGLCLRLTPAHRPAAWRWA
jgi:hypothetical protein